MGLFINRERKSRGWLRDVKCARQEQGPMVLAADFLSREGIDLPVIDSSYSKSSLFTVSQQSLNLRM